MATSQTIKQFAEGRPPKDGDKIVYVCGAFDMFHIGHLLFLEEAKKLGDYLIVGILTDQTVNEYKGGNHPIMSLHERVLSVLAYEPVNEVVIGAPREVTDDIIDGFNIKVVAQGSRVPHHEHEGPDPFIAPKKRGIFREIDSGSDMTTDIIIRRIIDHRLEYESRNSRKEKKEAAAFEALQKMKNGAAVDTMKTVHIQI
uniref:ethanolamine-phosphate cytidylyltransferase n=1 Tax=Heterorhabditis bacteriophora TaxID=37862 RepID=A0A1I7XVQ2_HETBA